METINNKIEIINNNILESNKLTLEQIKEIRKRIENIETEIKNIRLRILQENNKKEKEPINKNGYVNIPGLGWMPIKVPITTEKIKEEL